MRTVPQALQYRLDAGVTTLAHCWKIARRDGGVLGFTDHDEDIAFGGVTFRAGTGFTGSEATHRFDLSVDGSEIAGAFDDGALTEHDLAGGRYDAAAIETWLVDWSDISLRILTARGSLGEVRREGQAFSVELRGLADALAQDSGRLYTARCNADLGDARCKFSLATGGFHGAGTVEQLGGTSIFFAAGLGAFSAGRFTGGRLTWTSGPNNGLSIEIKEHRLTGEGVRLSLWQAMPERIAISDSFTVTAGCDKQFATCRDVFANTVNFRGFPHIPGNDFVIAYPTSGMPGNDGGSLQPSR